MILFGLPSMPHVMYDGPYYFDSYAQLELHHEYNVTSSATLSSANMADTVAFAEIQSATLDVCKHTCDITPTCYAFYFEEEVAGSGYGKCMGRGYGGIQIV